jgi:hypothetical protein
MRAAFRRPTRWSWRAAAGCGQVQALTDPAVTPFKVANDDWYISPDGGRVVFISALDRNIWVLDLPAVQ